MPPMPDNDNGLASTLAAFDRVRDAARQAAMKALTKDATELAAAQKRLAPKDTGALADSIAVTLPGESTPPYSQPGGMRVAGPNEVIVTAGNEDVRYAHLVEYGTSKTEAEPFFWPALRLFRTRFKRRDSRTIKQAIKKAWSGE
jgi:HK97 gp10 family phage protein